MRLSSLLGMILAAVMVGFIVLQFIKSPNNGAPRIIGGQAKLPCLANNHCPMGQACSNGFCTEGFITSVGPSTDMSSCSAKECNGINAPCARRGVPCPEGTFCQNDACVGIAAPDQGEAYGQIGMLL